MNWQTILIKIKTWLFRLPGFNLTSLCPIATSGKYLGSMSPIAARVHRTLTTAFLMLIVCTRFSAAAVFSIGNSLTWDTKPALLGDAAWHIADGANLKDIYNNPSGYDNAQSTQWDVALQNNTYDYLTIQPFRGTTLAEDTNFISAWMNMQPDATIVLHTGWAPSATHATDYETTSTQTMSPSASYFDALEQELTALHPGRTLRRTQAAQILYDIAQDIAAEQAPLNSLGELYRDFIHMSFSDGRYLMHNVMRMALNQGLDLDDNDTATPQRQYLNGKLQAALANDPAVPGDFNGDGTVNMSDYTVWRDNLGAPTEVALGNAGDGFGGVDSGDYLKWKSNFGTALVPGSIESFAVAEPGSLTLLVLAPCLAILFRRLSGLASQS